MDSTRLQTPDRRFWTPVRVLLLLLVVPAVWIAVSQRSAKYADTDVAAARDRLRAAAFASVQNGELQREDGAVYAVDVTQLATFAAMSNDRALYNPLREIILTQLLVERVPGDPAHGMVAWRYRPNPPEGELQQDASGTTEALRAAEALWHGSEAFGLDEDRATVALILDAYARHAARDNGTWMIRNYFNLHPDIYNFITNSFLVDYDPDLLTTVIEAGLEGKEDWDQVVAESAKLIDNAQTPAGLLHQMIRPEVATVMPHLVGDGLYSANGIEQLSNVLTVAERCARTNPAVSQRVLEFARDRMPQLRLYYHADTGRRLRGEQDTWAGVETWAPLLRLAVKLDDRRTAEVATRRVIGQSSGLPEYDGPDRMYRLGEALLALEYAMEYAENGSGPDP
ncbi:hypothetical protein [Algisphaera agarilytica]|uniref:hypothetical protein n=1 Tax=Algisphaera agarilytica TaxID=1385975 RepID=UPI001C881C99|nr:hypothetical protein [Algisphaera agarilytica]